jgi:hypothetical protein
VHATCLSTRPRYSLPTWKQADQHTQKKRRGKDLFVWDLQMRRKRRSRPLRDGRVEKNMIDSRPLLSISRCRVVKKKVAFLSIFWYGGGGDLSDTKATSTVGGFFRGRLFHTEINVWRPGMWASHLQRLKERSRRKQRKLPPDGRAGASGFALF